MNLGEWLRSLGLERYEALFRENAIDPDVLHDLTDDHLRELGLPLGARLKLLKAIGVLDKRAAVISPSLSIATISPPVDTGERRQVTVMFSDLVGSTALSTRMDPEDLREIISAYHGCVAETIRRFDGFVAKYLGDGVLVYFGYPQAHEDDAERAVEAGLELITAVAGLKMRATLETRIGIATGLVVVGDLIGSGDAQVRGIVGETPNLAARLQEIAEPNTVIIAESTRRLVGNLFELEDRGGRELKGMPGSVRIWAARRASAVESRFEALHTSSSLTSLVGREEEFELLLRRWSRAKSGEGQVVLLSGEPGIGKSRLTAALLERIGAEPHIRLRYFCSPQYTDSAFYPIIRQIERAAGLSYGDAPKSKLDKLDALLVRSSTTVQDAALVADMLSLPNDGRYPIIELTSEQRRQRTLEALTGQMVALARQNSLLMILEDMQWADPTSLEVFGRAVDRIGSLPVLLIVTVRPEFQPPWVGRAHVTALIINRLAGRDVEAMMDRVLGERQLPTGIRRDIIERTDGIPLFIEEMTKAVLETESEAAIIRTVASAPSSGRAVPASLHASLMARLDRLGSAKEVAQIGAAIGREFSYALLATVAGRREPELKLALEKLVNAGLLFCHGVVPHSTYLFKHALVQDAAYGTLLREPRRALHARIAETLQHQFVEVADIKPELLARHCTEAGLIEKAVDLWSKAGQISLSRSALVEAAEQLAHALTQIKTLAITPVLRRKQIELQVALISPLIHIKGYAAPETKAAAERARLLIEEAEALGEPPKDPLLLFSVLYSFWVANYVAFNGDVVRELSTQFLALAEKQRATAPLVIAHRLMGRSLLSTGEIAQGLAHFDRAIMLYNPSEHRPLATRFGQDVRVSILSYRSFALWILGYYEAAVADAELTLKDAREIGQAATLMYALYHTSLTHIHCGNYVAANSEAVELVSLAQEKSALYWKARGMINRGCILAVTGKASDAVQVLSVAITTYRSTGATLFLPWYLTDLAKAYADLAQFEEARRCIGEAMALLETGKEKWYEAEVKRIAGEVAFKSGGPDETSAQIYFEEALAVARQQQARCFELRAATSMARLWRDQDKRGEARALLASVFNWFPQGVDAIDVKEAKALLDSLVA